MPEVLNVTNLTLRGIGGAWSQADSYVIGTENALLIQNRADAVIHISEDQRSYYTIKAGRELLVPCFNSQGVRLYFRGPTGDVLEILRQEDV